MIHGAAALLAHPRIAAFRLMGRIFTCGQLFAVSERRTLPARQQKAVEHWLSGNCKIKGWGVGGGGGAFCSWLRRCAFSSLAQSENKKWRPLGDCAAFICSCTQTTDCGAVAGIIVNILSVCVFNMVAAVFCHFYTHSILNKSNGGFNLHKLKISRNLWDMPIGGLYLTTRTTHSGLFASTVLTRESKLKNELGWLWGNPFLPASIHNPAVNCAFLSLDLWLNRACAGRCSKQNQQNKTTRASSVIVTMCELESSITL